MRSKIFAAFLLLVLFGSCLGACTDNERARNYGGKETVTLAENHKFINITWKDDDMWVITQDTVSGIFYAREKSSYGLWEGEIKVLPATIESNAAAKSAAIPASSYQYVPSN